jgi:transposase
LYEQQLALTQSLGKANGDLQVLVSSLQLQLIDLKKLIFGGKQERFKPTSSTGAFVQDDLFPNDKLGVVVVEPVTVVKEVVKHAKTLRVNHPGRQALPELT